MRSFCIWIAAGCLLSTPVLARDTLYTYDALGRLVRVQRTGIDATGYAYDAADSRVNKVVAVPGAPVATNDLLTVPAGTSSVLNPLANDLDADGNTLTLTAATSGAHGSATVLSATQITYVAQAGYAGADTFTYTISDGTSTASATVYVTITSTGSNHPPVATGDTLSVASGGSLTFNPLTNDSDPEVDPLTVASITQPGIGSASFTASGITYNAPGTAGATSFTYRISDGTLLSAAATVAVTITAGNQAPTANDDYESWTTPSFPTSRAVYALVNDVEPDTGQTLSISSVSTPTNGAVASNMGSYINVTNISALGTTFTYVVSDGHGGVDTALVTLAPERDSCPEGQIC